MSKKTKKIILIICILIFIIGAPLVAFYSKGYRFDVENKKLTKTGAFFIEVKPTRTNIYLNEVKERRTDLFFGSSFIKNLIPKKYNLKLVKEGYHAWKKNLEIKEQTVTEVTNVSLIPKNPEQEKINSKIERLWFFPNNTKILLKNKAEEDWELKLYNLDKKLKSHLIAKDDFSTSSIDLLELNFGPNSEKILFKLGIKEQIKYQILTTEPFPPKLKKLSKLANIKPGEKVIFNPNNTNEIIFQKNNNIYVYNIETEEINYYYPDLSQNGKEIITFAKNYNSNNLIFLTESGFIYNSYPGEKINSKKLDIKKETEYKIKDSNNFIFILEKQSGSFYAINKETKKITLVDKRINSFTFSPHRDKLAYNSDYEIKTFYLKDQSSQPFNKKGDKIFISRFSNKIKQLEWLNNEYLIFKANNTVKITEADTRDNINVVNLLTFEGKFNLKWESSNKELLVYKDKELFSYKLFTF